MANEWYYKTLHGDRQGPVSDMELKNLATSGALLPTDLIWKEPMTEWRPASNVRGLFPEKPQVPPPVMSSPIQSPPPPPAPNTPPITPAAAPQETFMSKVSANAKIAKDMVSHRVSLENIQRRLIPNAFLTIGQKAFQQCVGEQAGQVMFTELNEISQRVLTGSMITAQKERLALSKKLTELGQFLSDRRELDTQQILANDFAVLDNLQAESARLQSEIGSLSTQGDGDLRKKLMIAAGVGGLVLLLAVMWLFSESGDIKLVKNAVYSEVFDRYPLGGVWGQKEPMIKDVLGRPFSPKYKKEMGEMLKHSNWNKNEINEYLNQKPGAKWTAKTDEKGRRIVSCHMTVKEMEGPEIVKQRIRMDFVVDKSEKSPVSFSAFFVDGKVRYPDGRISTWYRNVVEKD